jgi:hypothetical protein
MRGAIDIQLGRPVPLLYWDIEAQDLCLPGADLPPARPVPLYWDIEAQDIRVSDEAPKCAARYFIGSIFPF